MRFHTKILLPFFLCFIIAVRAQKNPKKSPCAPVPGTCEVCDSSARLHRSDAVQIACRAVQDSSSPWYDSIRLPETLIRDIQRDLAIIYNNLPDSLAGLHTVHDYDAGVSPNILVVMPDFQKVKYDPADSVRPATASLDSLFRVYGISKTADYPAKGFYQSWYRLSAPVNFDALRRMAAKLAPNVQLSYYGMREGFGGESHIYLNKDPNNPRQYLFSVGGGELRLPSRYVITLGAGCSIKSVEGPEEYYHRGRKFY